MPCPVDRDDIVPFTNYYLKTYLVGTRVLIIMKE